ncbi:hypothetical protein QN383_18575 [Pseudomonas sp. AA4]|uniref:hypothetical protein n=1 Tax=unclassified Pseudomonas TaxID=196821 RepID=UPI002B232DCE|nr:MULTISPECIES: hypothetical protein [unclassified Pseudomonas]MEA9996440.1 hypothetical protein [Pseudomonas sp. AA4]MEB0222147.1 hypothetical protein [Pseudomonas sp. AB12(2023)]
MDTKIDRALMSRERADIDAQLNAKESFAARIGLLPFAAGALAALAAFMLISHM